MHVVLISDLEREGGAAIAASRLAQGLVAAGHRVTRVVASSSPGQGHGWATEVIAAPPSAPSLPVRAVRRLLRPLRKGAAQEAASAPRSARVEKRVGMELRALLDELRPDVLNIHNLHFAEKDGWSLDLLRVGARYAPIVWTLHDMWSFTGRCAYSYDCRLFLTGCDASCPTADEYPALAPRKIAPAWEKRRRFFAEHPALAAVAPSQWLAREARAGFWQGHRVAVIPYGLPLDVFRPTPPPEARAELGLPTSGPVLLAAAQVLTVRRKGGFYLTEALQQVARQHGPLTLLTLGGGEMRFGSENIRVHPLGFITDDRLKALAYSAADLFVHPAPVDNLPNVVLEALACGTPVVGFPIGGVPDMVRPGRTGWLAGELSSEALARALDQALGDLGRGVCLRAACRAVAEEEYPLHLQAQRYITLFREMRGRLPDCRDNHAHQADQENRPTVA